MSMEDLQKNESAQLTETVIGELVAWLRTHPGAICREGTRCQSPAIPATLRGPRGIFLRAAEARGLIRFSESKPGISTWFASTTPSPAPRLEGDVEKYGE